MGKVIDILGKKFGWLTVIEFVDVKNESARWKCKCICENEVIVYAYSIKRGTTKSCGCYHRLQSRKANTKHGGAYLLAYSSWRQMIHRCTKETNSRYEYYGGRGITVCKRWLNSFEAFLEDMGDRPSKKHSIERIDNNKGYYKENCRWATAKEQASNRRNKNACLLTFGGETKTLSEWAKIKEINKNTLYGRIYTSKWSIKRALTTPVKKRVIKN